MKVALIVALLITISFVLGEKPCHVALLEKCKQKMITFAVTALDEEVGLKEQECGIVQVRRDIIERKKRKDRWFPLVPRLKGFKAIALNSNRSLQIFYSIKIQNVFRANVLLLLLQWRANTRKVTFFAFMRR